MKTKSLNILFVIFFTICISAVSTYATELKTEKGEPSKLSNIRSGLKYNISAAKKEIISGHDSTGEEIIGEIGPQYEFNETNDIQLSIENSFGYEFKLGKINTGDKLIIRLKVILPHPVNYKGEAVKSIDADLPYMPSHSYKNSAIWWDFDEDQHDFHIKGIWTLELYNQGSLIISKQFNVF